LNFKTASKIEKRRREMRRNKNIICPYCNEILTRYKKLKTHIEESHEGKIMPEWVIKEATK